MQDLINDTLTLMYIWDKTEENGDCLEWTGAKDSYGCPIMRLPGSRLFRPVRRVIMEMNGIVLGKKLASCSCQNPLCVKHLCGMTRKQLQTRSAKTINYHKSIERRKAISLKRRETATLDMAKAREIRDDQTMTPREKAKLYGVQPSTILKVLNYETWVDYSNPYMQLMA